MSESVSAAKRRQRRIPDEFRKRNAQSCDLCRKRRCRCVPAPDGQGCVACHEHNVPCAYTTPRKTRFYGSVDDLSDRYRCLDAIVKGAFPNDLTATAEDLVELGRRMGYSMPDFSQPRRKGVKIEDLVRAPDPVASSRHNSVAESRISGSELGTGSAAPSEVGTDDATSAAAAGAEDAQLSLIRDTSGNEHYIGPSGTLNFLSQLRRLMVSSEGTPEAQPEVVTKFTQDDTAQALEADDSPEAPGALDPATQTDGALEGPSPASVTSVTSIAKDFTRMPTVDLDEMLRGLPADETLELLVQSYFKNVHDDYPLFHRATFEDEYELYIVQARRRLQFLPQSQAQPQNRSNAVPDWGWMGCLHMIIVFGSIARPDIPGVDHSHLRRRSVAAARTLLPQFISKCTLSNVRVLMLLSLFLHNNNERNAAWNLVGTATRIAFALGLHRSDMSSSLRPLDREVRKWVFCTLYSFEQFLASSLGRPSGLQEMDVEIVPPREGFLDAGTGTDAKLQRRPDAEGQDVVPRPSVDDIMRSLAAWKRDVAENPNFHMPDIQTRVSLRGSGSSASLHDEDGDAIEFDELKYHYIAIVATRPILLREIAAARKALRDEGHGAPPAMSTVADACVRHAVQLTYMVLFLDGFELVNGLSGLDVFYAYCAAMVLILRLLRKPPTAEGAEASDQHEEQVQASGSMKRFASEDGVTTYGAPNVQLDDGGFYFHPFNGSETTAPPEWGDMEMVMAGYGMPR
ncbi:putative transcriptional regulatory protein C3C7.04 like [Verticillium longisporum]|uniref:Putative transcriptional regulatory protein C3C7.04 like n=1 Tax=Verticillium longisporum TaxID=100787 RepID=A0A8I3A306_VERLO|nr:putative transcriptional regulatory protein C3C7.04 like [Verticillium longisporum]